MPGLGSGRRSRRSELSSPDIDPDNRADAEATALRILAGASQSAHQLQSRLERRGYTPEASADVIGSLRAAGWIDDAALAGAVVRRRLERGYGRRRIRADLVTRGLGREDVSQALTDVEAAAEAGAVRETAERLRRRYPAGRLDRASLSRLAAALARRGFDHNLVRAALREIDAADSMPDPDDGAQPGA